MRATCANIVQYMPSFFYPKPSNWFNPLLIHKLNLRLYTEQSLEKKTIVKICTMLARGFIKLRAQQVKENCLYNYSCIILENIQSLESLSKSPAFGLWLSVCLSVSLVCVRYDSFWKILIYLCNPFHKNYNCTCHATPPFVRPCAAPEMEDDKDDILVCASISNYGY